MQSGAKTPKGLDGFLRAGNDDGVKAEKKPGEGGYERPKENLFFHKVNGGGGGYFHTLRSSCVASSENFTGTPVTVSSMPNASRFGTPARTKELTARGIMRKF